VGKALVLETTFLIDLERERKRGSAGFAIAFFEENQDARFYVPFTVAGELAAGDSLADRSHWDEILAPFFVLASSPEVSWEYGRIYRHLKRNGQLIGANDIWIAATARANRMALVTRNREHFRRVPDLELQAY